MMGTDTDRQEVHSGVIPAAGLKVAAGNIHVPDETRDTFIKTQCDRNQLQPGVNTQIRQ